MEPLYRLTHALHHTFRPPTPYTAAAVDPIHGALIGIGSFLAPMFLLPVHLPTAYVLLLLFELWSVFIHSGSHWKGTWLLPVDHSQHHMFGARNGNYGAFTTLPDRLFGTLIRDVPGKEPHWIATERAERKAASLAGHLHVSCERLEESEGLVRGCSSVGVQEPSAPVPRCRLRAPRARAAPVPLQRRGAEEEAQSPPLPRSQPRRASPRRSA